MKLKCYIIKYVSLYLFLFSSGSPFARKRFRSRSFRSILRFSRSKSVVTPVARYSVGSAKEDTSVKLRIQMSNNCPDHVQVFRISVQRKTPRPPVPAPAAPPTVAALGSGPIQLFIRAMTTATRQHISQPALAPRRQPLRLEAENMVRQVKYMREKVQFVRV